MTVPMAAASSSKRDTAAPQVPSLSPPSSPSGRTYNASSAASTPLSSASASSRLARGSFRGGGGGGGGGGASSSAASEPVAAAASAASAEKLATNAASGSALSSPVYVCVTPSGVDTTTAGRLSTSCIETTSAADSCTMPKSRPLRRRVEMALYMSGTSRLLVKSRTFGTSGRDRWNASKPSRLSTCITCSSLSFTLAPSRSAFAVRPPM
mmetsp:Transcript_4831/g.14678  ORF Transcript_4831/g.14678 Transcript_4831/m.14678 type:complete len:210 (+) Transcript_4831:102-731(+)